jgi:hypothetical protein
MSILPLYAQSGFNTIEIKKGFPNPGYKYGEVVLSLPDVSPVLKKNEPAYSLLKPAKVNYSLANLFSYLGIGGLIAPLQLLIPPLPNTQRKENSGRYVWPFIGIGMGAFAIAIPLRIKAHKQAAKAVGVFNSTLEGKLYIPQPSNVTCGTTANGIGLTVHY